MKKKLIKTIVQLILTIGILILLGILIKSKYSEIKQYSYNLNILYLLGSFLFLFAANMVLMLNWYFITKKIGCNLSIIDTIRIRLISEIGKYFPGRVLGYGYLLIRYKEAGKDQIKVMNSSVYELFFSFFSAFLFFTIIFIFIQFPILGQYREYFFLGSFIGIILMHPSFFRKFSDIFCKVLNRERVIYNISYFDVLKILMIYLFDWLIFGVGFYFFVRSFTKIDFPNIGYISGTFAISTFAGFLAFFIPAGIGAREGLLILLLGNLTGNTFAIIISIGSRIWSIIADTLMFILALGSVLLFKGKKNFIEKQLTH